MSILRVHVLLAACALAFSGCVSERQVRSIVNDSNYQMLLASAPGLETGLAPNPAAGGATPPDDAAARITAFLAAHQNDPSMAGALRLRETLIYLSQRTFALADATAKQIDPQALHSTRDRALAAAYPDLRWWAEYSLTSEITFASTQKAAALRHIASLEQHAADPALAASPDLRDYFLEMRAWIGLKLGLATANDPAFTRDTVQKAIDTWTAVFSAEELALLVSTDFKTAKPFDLSTRRAIHLRVLLAALAESMHGQRAAGVTPPDLTFARPEVQSCYGTFPH